MRAGAQNEQIVYRTCAERRGRGEGCRCDVRRGHRHQSLDRRLPGGGYGWNTIRRRGRRAWGETLSVPDIGRKAGVAQTDGADEHREIYNSVMIGKNVLIHAGATDLSRPVFLAAVYLATFTGCPLSQAMVVVSKPVGEIDVSEKLIGIGKSVFRCR